MAGRGGCQEWREEWRAGGRGCQVGRGGREGSEEGEKREGVGIGEGAEGVRRVGKEGWVG